MLLSVYNPVRGLSRRLLANWGMQGYSVILVGYYFSSEDWKGPLEAKHLLSTESLPTGDEHPSRARQPGRPQPSTLASDESPPQTHPRYFRLQAAFTHRRLLRTMQKIV